MSEHRAWSYRDGDGLGVLGERIAVLLPPSDRARAARSWELVDGGADVEEVLDAVLAGGLRDLTDLVLVGLLGEETRVLVRGSARVVLDRGGEPVRVAHDGRTTWVEEVLTGVTRVRVDIGAGPPDEAAADRTVDGGLIRVGRLERFLEPVLEPVPGPDTDLADLSDHDGQTRSGAPAGPLRPGIPGQEPAPVVTGRPVARLVFSGGESVPVDRSVLVGRAPQPRRHTQTQEPRLVTVTSPQQEISSTHLEVRPGCGADHGVAVVTDLGSTNGTQLRQPGLPIEPLRPGSVVALIPGAVLDLGDGVTIRVLAP